MSVKTKRSLGTKLLRFVPLRSARSNAAKKTIAHFAESLGLVYFGYVDQHADEHELVRGFTLSMDHRDNHYCVGSVNGYDVILVERTDEISFPDKPGQRFEWLILQIDLRSHDYPHAFFSSVRHSDTYYSNLFIKYARFQKLDLRLWTGHDPAFTQEFSIFAAPEANYELGRLFTPDITVAMAHHFKGLEFELAQDKLYVYANNQSVTPALLDRITKNGLWLASQLDAARALRDQP